MFNNQRLDDLKYIYHGAGITYYQLDYGDFKVYFKLESGKIVYCGQEEIIYERKISNPKWVLDIFGVKPGDFYCNSPS